MFRTAIGRLRIIGLLEGLSYLILLGIAMPLKYGLDMPEMVSIVGMAHGILFVLFCLAALHVMIRHRKSILWGLGAFVSSLVPFGTFVLDRRLRNETAR